MYNHEDIRSPSRHWLYKGKIKAVASITKTKDDYPKVSLHMKFLWSYWGLSVDSVSRNCIDYYIANGTKSFGELGNSASIEWQVRDWCVHNK